MHAAAYLLTLQWTLTFNNFISPEIQLRKQIRELRNAYCFFQWLSEGIKKVRFWKTFRNLETVIFVKFLSFV